VNRQKALTPKFLRAFYHCFHKPDPSTISDSTFPPCYSHAADLLLAGFFWAMRSCEYCATPVPGRTLPVSLGCVVFRDSDRRVLPHTHPELSATAHFVTVTFVEQKNKQKMDSRTQRRTLDAVLCPVRRMASAVKRVLMFDPSARPDTKLASLRAPTGTLTISNTFMLESLRFVCKYKGGKDKFGFSPDEIGNKSLRSGAAMSLFLMDYSPAKIMILGRWNSDAFLDYIRPQVLEWANNMSQSMILPDDYRDVASKEAVGETDPRFTRRNLPQPFDGVQATPRYYLHY